MDQTTTRTATVRRLRGIWRDFRNGWRALPSSVRRRWVVVILVGLVLCELLSCGLALGARQLARDGLRAWDEDALRRVEQFSLIDVQRAVFLQALGTTPFLAILIAWGIQAETAAGRPLRGASLPVAFFGAKLLTLTGWWLWSRPRPTLILEGVLGPSLNAFPSGHAVQSVAVFGLLTWFWVTASRNRVEQAVAWTLLVVLVGLIGEARVRIGAHWPSDVIAGTLIGAAWLAVLIVALHRTSVPAPPA